MRFTAWVALCSVHACVRACVHACVRARVCDPYGLLLTQVKVFSPETTFQCPAYPTRNAVILAGGMNDHRYMATCTKIIK